MEFSLSAGTRQVGKVQVTKEGLYWRVICHAQLFGSIMYRLVAVTGGRRENVGILAPSGEGYSLDRRIPLKNLEEEGLQFLLLPSHEPMEGKFVPITPEEPFSYLENLKDAYLARQKGRLGVILPEN